MTFPQEIFLKQHMQLQLRRVYSIFHFKYKIEEDIRDKYKLPCTLLPNNIRSILHQSSIVFNLEGNID